MMTPPRAMPSGSVAPRERRATSPGTVAPANLTAPSEPVIRDTLLDLSSTDRTPVFRPEELGLAADTMPAMPAMPAIDAAQPSVSVVRFRAPSIPPPSTASPAVAPSPAASPPAAAHRSPAPAPSPAHRSPAPAPSPATASPASRETPPHVVMMTSTRRQRLITPATALFAEPESDGAAATAVTTSLHGLPDAPPLAGRRIPLGRVLIVVLCLVLVSAATTAAGLYLTRDQDTSRVPRPAPPSPPPDRTFGTVHFTVAPADATIAISGKPLARKLEHRASPWDVELAPGGYQVEIERDGYKGWLTSIDVAAGKDIPLPVELEAVGSAVITEATLVVRAPGGLDITVDGVGFGKTPSRLSITAGHHAVALRAGDAELWRKDIEVRASAIYDLHPAIAAPPPAAGSPASPAGSSGAPAAPPAPPGQPAGTGSADPAPAADASPPSPSPAAPAPAPAAPAADPASPGAPPPAAVPAPTAATPVLVPAAAVHRIAGPPPRITPPAGTALPATITAKLCIDDAGRVTSVEVTTPLDPDLATQITGALRTWQYAPYRAGGTAQAVCFQVAFRT
jgi:hypothetical protein